MHVFMGKVALAYEGQKVIVSLPFENGFLTDWELTDLASELWRSLCRWFLRAEITRRCYHTIMPPFLCGPWDFKLGSPCLCCKDFTHRTIFPVLSSKYFCMSYGERHQATWRIWCQLWPSSPERYTFMHWFIIWYTLSELSKRFWGPSRNPKMPTSPSLHYHEK